MRPALGHDGGPSKGPPNPPGHDGGPSKGPPNAGDPRASATGIALLLSLILAGCAPPTAITVDVYTEVACAKNAEVSVTLADALSALSSSAPSTTSTGCLDQNGHVGSVVITPASDGGKLVTFAVATRDDGGTTEGCLMSPLPDACIVARRQLRYDSHLDLPVRVDLRDACRGVDCPPEQTCAKGSCVSAAVPVGCAGACDDGQLPAAGGPSRLTTTGGKGVQLVATDKGFAAAWPQAEPGGELAVRLQPLDGNGAPAAPVSGPIAKGPMSISGLLLGYDGKDYGLAVLNMTTASVLVVTGDGSAVGGPTMLSGVQGLPGHGLPWGGSYFGLFIDDLTTGGVYVHFYDGQAIEVGIGGGISPAAVSSTEVWDGTSTFAASYVDASQSCGFAYVQDTSSAPGIRGSHPDCADLAMAPAGGGNWHMVSQTLSTPTRVLYQSTTSDGTVIAGPIQISPVDSQSYVGAQVVPTPSGAAIFFTVDQGMTAPLYRADVDATGKILAQPALVPSVAVGSEDYAVTVSGNKIGLAWSGRLDSSGQAPNGIYSATLDVDP